MNSDDVEWMHAQQEIYDQVYNAPADDQPEPHNYMPELIMALCGINPICDTCHEALGLCKCPPEQKGQA